MGLCPFKKIPYHIKAEENDVTRGDKIIKENGLISRGDLLKLLLDFYEGKSQESVESTKETEIPDSNDFGAFSCKYRRPLDSQNYECWAKRSLARVQNDRVVPKDICRQCEKDQFGQKFINPVTKSGQAFNIYLDHKQQQKLEYLKAAENIKTEAVRKREQIKTEEQARRQRNNGGGGGGYTRKIDMGNNEEIDMLDIESYYH